MSTVRIRTFNRRKAERFGLKLDWKTRLLYGAIEMRSKVKVFDWDKVKGWGKVKGELNGGWLIDPEIGWELLRSGSLVVDGNGNWWYYADHTEIQFSDTYGGLSFSATTVDGSACCRLKKIMYSHEAERWDTVEIEVTPEQEEKMFREACRMADVGLFDMKRKIHGGAIADKQVFHGPNAIPYDKTMFIAFVHSWKVWKVSPKKRHCTRAVCEVATCGGLPSGACDEKMPAQYHLQMMELKNRIGNGSVLTK